MNNLFIMHTQYNLILSVATMQKFIDATNTLVLYAEFSLSNEMHHTLTNLFDNVIVVRDKFIPLMKPLDEIKYIKRCMKKIEPIRNKKFDNIFMSQERIFDMIVCARAKKCNPDARCYNIEEDAYYSINEKYDDNYIHIENSRTKLRKFLFAFLLIGYPYNYKDIHYCYGMSEEYDCANLLFPKLARKELLSKELIEITQEELLSGINALYANATVDYPDGQKYTVIFFDLVSRYKNAETVKKIVKKIVYASQMSGRTILVKYHPRENNKFEGIKQTFELQHIIPAEKVLFDLQGTDTIVVGNATTSCIVAAKLKYKVISISKIEFPNNKKMHNAMEKMGILCAENTDQITSIVK